MLRRLLAWLWRPKSDVSSVDEVTRRAESRLQRAEGHIAAQRREGEVAVNLIYDRIIHNRGGAA